MAGNISLSRRDIDVLGKIRDPESNPESGLRLDPSLPKDPHITDAVEYDAVSQRERELILSMQEAEMELAGLKEKTLPDPVEAYRACVARLGRLVEEHPRYASARNNRAQALRRLYGDDMLLEPIIDGPVLGSPRPQRGVEAILSGPAADATERAEAAATVLSDLDRAIALLMPAPASLASAALSPTAAKTLSLAFTQRAAIYYASSKQLASNSRRCNAAVDRPEARWSEMDFEEAASRDFAMGGRFGNEIARGLAVGTNPTAKLCGQMVQQMMKGEYGAENGSGSKV
ncbi:hypothetical protein HMPREF1624_07192 [Sporothrix schenckii ATCC 58251]|uniref:Tetratricopeptide repeat protein 36 n=1 Tax=Sporothrix schenckii (strain ATCC 58251 / de Perez 2211183) TaxID=1391915 RepID=U7PKV8_SPOS1|nr:hypothetical protein HMPREF1624_07192 [Sporothrix schenckii ATCC 58251]